jgi:Protein of unknown function (DUF3810)
VIRRLRRLVLPLVAAALALVPLPAHFVERVYAAGWYPHLQPLLTRVSNGVPFAWLDPLVALTAGAMLIGAARAWRRAGSPWWRRVANVVILALQAAAFLYVAFLVLWGFNYRRAPAVERLHVAPERVTADRLARLSSRAVAQVNALHDPARSRAGLRGDVLIATMAPAFAQAQGLLGSRWRMTPGRPKASFIGRTFPLSGVDGMINPFGLEVILNPEVLPFERPYVLAHEWAHLAGHAPESEASFVAFLACLQGPPDMQYSGWLDLLLHVARALSPAARRDTLEAIGQGPRADLRAIETRLRRVQPAVHQVSWSVYDQYLRANRVASGVADYGEVLNLVLGSPLTASAVNP